mmetsp:Transcript_14609/g.27714  ORF Transcript_14609/g.27714 Transcript_14609/m.27714 type:complete len:120 (+) Transcript_14609:10-369(+)
MEGQAESSCLRRAYQSVSRRCATMNIHSGRSRIKALLLCLLLIIVLTYGLVLKVSYMLAGMVLLVCVVTSFLVPFRLADRARTQNRAYEQVPQQVYGQNAAAQEYVLGVVKTPVKNATS